MADQFDLQSMRQWRTFSSLSIKESPYFTEIIQKLLPDELCVGLQLALIRQPDIGDLIPGGGGLRKIRWKKPGSGKRGGIRVIYYRITEDQEILMLYAYAKNKIENLSQKHIRVLRKIVEEELKNG